MLALTKRLNLHVTKQTPVFEDQLIQFKGPGEI